MMRRQTPKNSNRPTRKSKSRSVSPYVVSGRVGNKENVTQRKMGKENEGGQKAESMKICLELASYHQKQGEELKVKNEVLEYRLKEQVQGMEKLRRELNEIKASLQGTHINPKKENEALKLENTQLKVKIDQLTKENEELRTKMQPAVESIMLGDSKQDEEDIKMLTMAKESRRQKLANNYESFTFVASTNCLECERHSAQLEEEREKYCNQLRLLQQQVCVMQQNQLMIGVMETQMVDKEKCIAFLRNQLTTLESNSHRILQFMRVLEQRMEELSLENSMLRGYSLRSEGSHSKTVT